MWIIYALLSAISAALVAVLGKIGLQNIDATLGTTVRASIMAVFLIIVSLSLGKFSSAHIDNKALLFIALSAIAGALSWLWYFIALKTGPATAVAALDRLSIVFVVIFAVTFLGQALTIKTVLGSILIVGGVLLML